MNFEEYKAMIKADGYELGKVLESGGYSRFSAKQDADRNNGEVKQRYIMLYIAYKYINDPLLQRIARYKDNKALLALLVELDSKAESSQEKEKLEQLFNPPSMEQAK